MYREAREIDPTLFRISSCFLALLQIDIPASMD